MKQFFAALTVGVLVNWPSHSWAGCTYADGTPAPEPGVSQEAQDSLDWGPTFVKLFKGLSDGDKSTLVAILRQSDAVLLTTKCSANDLFWTHLSLVEMSEEAPDVIPEEWPQELADNSRAFGLTEYGREVLPGLLQTAARMN